MLHIRRRAGESLVINDTIRVTVLDVKGRHVQLGLHGPEGTRAFRSEVYDKITLENQRATESYSRFCTLVQTSDMAAAVVDGAESSSG